MKVWAKAEKSCLLGRPGPPVWNKMLPFDFSGAGALMSSSVSFSLLL